MDFALTPEQREMKQAFDAFFKQEMKGAPKGWTGSLEDIYSSDKGWAFHRHMAKKLAQKGWLARAWPKEYGGESAPILDQLLFSESAGYHLAPGIDIFGIGMIGPTLLVYGNEEQKREHLSPIARGEQMWCQLWSEPNAGSDLAALKTTARREGNVYILNGQKIWTSGAHRADWGFGVFRTDPAQKGSKGISFLLLDMKTPGITVNPLLGMNRAHLFNEVFFDDVRVPVENRLGEENQGWTVTRTVMNFERSNIGGIATAKRILDELVAFLKTCKRSSRPLTEDPIVKDELAKMAVEIEVGRALSYKVAWIQEKGDIFQAVPLASAAKAFGTETMQRVIYRALEILGQAGVTKNESPLSVMLGRFETLFQVIPGMNIAGGSSEVQRNLIAWTALGLPRSWDEVFKKPTKS